MDRKVLVNESFFFDMAKAIQVKKSDTKKRKPREMVEAVKSLNSNLGTFDSDITVNVVQSANQTITATVKDYQLNKSDNTSGFRLYGDFTIDATVTADSGYKAGMVSIARSNNTITITASEAVKQDGNVNTTGWVEYWANEYGQPYKVINGKREDWDGMLIDAGRAVLEFGTMTLIVLAFNNSSEVMTSTIVKLGDITRSVEGFPLQNKITLGTAFAAKILDLNTAPLQSVDANGKGIVIDARKLPISNFESVFESMTNGRNANVAFIIDPNTYDNAIYPDELLITVVVDDSKGDVREVTRDLINRGADAQTLTYFKQRNPTLADYIE